MLMAGFTTVQSVGAAGDKSLREAIAAGVVNGPRLLTSLAQIQGGSSTPEQLRERIRQAESLNLGDRIGTLKAGYEADIVAVPNDPLTDITRLRDVMFVMRGGRVMRK